MDPIPTPFLQKSHVFIDKKKVISLNLELHFKKM